MLQTCALPPPASTVWVSAAKLRVMGAQTEPVDAQAIPAPDVGHTTTQLWAPAGDVVPSAHATHTPPVWGFA